MRRRIVITGLGAVTPLGLTVNDLYQNQLEGKSGAGPITWFDASRFPTTFACQVKNFDLGRFVKDPQRWAQSGVNTTFALAAAKQALEDAGLLDNAKVDRTRFGVYLGSGEGIQDFHHVISIVAKTYDPATGKVDNTRFAAEGMKLFNPGREYEQELHTTQRHIFSADGQYHRVGSCESHKG